MMPTHDKNSPWIRNVSSEIANVVQKCQEMYAAKQLRNIDHCKFFNSGVTVYTMKVATAKSMEMMKQTTIQIHTSSILEIVEEQSISSGVDPPDQDTKVANFNTTWAGIFRLKVFEILVHPRVWDHKE